MATVNVSGLSGVPKLQFLMLACSYLTELVFNFISAQPTEVGCPLPIYWLSAIWSTSHTHKDGKVRDVQ